MTIKYLLLNEWGKCMFMFYIHLYLQVYTTGASAVHTGETAICNAYIPFGR